MLKFTCPECGSSIERKKPTGPIPTYCSRACRSRVYYKNTGAHRRTASRVLARESRTCAWEKCATLLNDGDDRRANKWCSIHRAERKRAETKDNVSAQCTEPDCGRPVRAKGICNMHYKRVLRAEGRIKNEPFDGDRMRRHYERRTWQKAGESVTVDGLRERDGDDCGLCGQVIDFSLSGRDPMGRSVDHVLPRSRGGAHTWDNCQLTHLRCNLSKGATVPQ